MLFGCTGGDFSSSSVTVDNIRRVAPGMTERDVRNILGPPFEVVQDASLSRRILAGLFFVLVAPIHASQESPVWFWFATCGPSMTLEVRFDNTLIERASFPICRAPRNSPASQGQAARIEFSFSPRRAIVWSGYRDKTERSKAGQVLEFNVWQAGADSAALTLGISVTATDRILMNSVHIAHSDKRHQSAIAPGLMVTTYPTPR